jgi:flagellar basal-body rod modification protein FlgD
MSQITPATSITTAATSGGTSAASSAAVPGGALGQNQFLQLMMTQLQNQDPLNPSDPTQYLSELAQFTSVEQMTNIATSSAQAATEQKTAAALALIGHTVTYINTAGTSVTGTVQKVDFASSGPTLTISGVTGIDPNAVNEVS